MYKKALFLIAVLVLSFGFTFAKVELLDTGEKTVLLAEHRLDDKENGCDAVFGDPECRHLLLFPEGIGHRQSGFRRMPVWQEANRIWQAEDGNRHPASGQEKDSLLTWIVLAPEVRRMPGKEG